MNYTKVWLKAPHPSLHLNHAIPRQSETIKTLQLETIVTPSETEDFDEQRIPSPKDILIPFVRLCP